MRRNEGDVIVGAFQEANAWSQTSLAVDKSDKASFADDFIYDTCIKEPKVLKMPCKTYVNM